jgi:SAM-dependent methyltransferase
MREVSASEWIASGVKWYGIVALGGILFLVRSAGWILHDVWCRLRGVEAPEEFIISRSAGRLGLIALFTLLFGVIHIFNILLVVPLLMGQQHLMRTRMRGSEQKGDRQSQRDTDPGRWYDGLIYAVGADPMFRKAREMIVDHIPEESKVIDVCCGTGALVFRIAGRCEHVTGVDYSRGMIDYAEKEKGIKGLTNVEFVHTDATDLSRYQDHVFDYAVLSFTLHEMPRDIRLPVLKEAARVSDHVIIVDHMIPMPMNTAGIIDLYLEFNAGYDNFLDFLTFQDNGGLDGLVRELGLTIQEETTVNHGTFRFLKTRKAES